MKMDGNGRKNTISISVSISFGGNRIRFGKCGFGNGIRIYEYAETNKYGRKINGNGRKPEYRTFL
jgi:hypothetical protein